MSNRLCVMGLLGGSLFLIGCGGAGIASKTDIEKTIGGTMKKVVPIKGTVLVDDHAEKGVMVSLYKSADLENPLKQVATDEKGNYCFNTYTSCDGIEPGEYKLTFRWSNITGAFARNKGKGQDKLNDRYSDPQKYEHSLTVAEGTPQSKLDFSLTTK